MDSTIGQNIDLALQSMGIDPMFLIKEVFLGYKYRKREKILYDQDRELPTKLIKLYYGLYDEKMSFDRLRKEFITHYIHEESQLEGVDIKDKHSKTEVLGMKRMYEYINSDEIDEDFNIYTLKNLHKALYSETPYPEFGGKTRKDDCYLAGTKTELCGWQFINQRLFNLSSRVDELVERGKNIQNTGNIDNLIKYIDDVVELKCELIYIHPFPDGNGRCVRGFINKLLEYADLPPIYIKVSERLEYHKAMSLAINEKKYDDIKNFYKYKICDSIVELDINERILKDKEEAKQKKLEKEH